MPSVEDSLNSATAIAKVLFQALNIIETYATATQVGPDGEPSGNALYMHMMQGYPVDPKMFANPWSPGGLSSDGSINDEGTVNQPAPGSATDPVTAALKLEEAIQNALYTSRLVDDMLEITDKGVASYWPDRQISIEYGGTILPGVQPIPVTDAPDKAVLDAVDAAQKLLWTTNSLGTRVPTQAYLDYKKYKGIWAEAVAKNATAYAQAMSDPALGSVWPVTSATYAEAEADAKSDFETLGNRQQVANALNVIKTQGQNAITALAALAQDFYDSYKINLGGSVTAPTPWSYISPVSWWDHNDHSFGAQSITLQSSSSASGGFSTASTAAKNWWSSHSSSAGGSLSIGIGPFSAGGNESEARTGSAFQNTSHGSTWSDNHDKSSKASISFEYFVATIERLWFFGDLLNVDGWYLKGQKKNSISDGTIDGQLGAPSDKILPMLPKAFVIVRNVIITADDWGDAGNAFAASHQDSSGSSDSSSSSMGLSVGYLFSSGSLNKSQQNADTNAASSGSSDSGWSYQKGENSGTLTLSGSQIVGWIGEIQPASPKQPAPMSTTGAT